MPYKDKEAKKAHDAAYGASWYQRNKEAVKARVAQNKRIGRERWIEFKSQQACSHCGFSHPAVIDFHHVVRDGTQQSVNRMAADNKWNQIYGEIKKCIPLCSNCHRILHWGESRNKAITKDMTNRTGNSTEERTNDDDSGKTEHP